MRTDKRILLTVAAGLILVGGTLFLIALASVGFDFSKLGTEVHITSKARLTDSFSSLSAELADCDLVLEHAPDEQARAVIRCSPDALVDVTVEKGVLRIRQKEKASGFRFFDFDSASVTLYLPEDLFLDVSVKTGSGKITSNTLNPFSRIEVQTGSGGICWHGQTAKTISLSSTSGEIDLRRMTVGDGIGIATTSGDVTLSDISTEDPVTVHTSNGDVFLKNTASGNLTVQTSSGEIKTDVMTVQGVGRLESTSGTMKLGDLVLSGACAIKTSSGDVHFLRCASAKFNITTSSGDVTGSLLGETVGIRGSGSVSHSQSTTTPWSITTSSGYHHIYPAE